jgi:hypothetical protein
MLLAEKVHGLRSPRSTEIAALFELTKPVPSPFSRLGELDIQSQSEALKSKWKDWIDANDRQLRKFTPTADGISFDSRTCSRFHVGVVQ